MGLDAWVRGINKLTKDEVKQLNGMNYADLPYKYTAVAEDEFGHSLQDLKPYVAKVFLVDKEIDEERIKFDYNISPDAKLTGLSNNNMVYDDRGIHYDVALTYDETYARYGYSRMKVFYVWKEEDVYYWRKNYNVQSYMRDLYGAENCGYYEITLGDLFNLMDMKGCGWGEPRSDLNLDKYDAIFYHEWY